MRSHRLLVPAALVAALALAGCSTDDVKNEVAKKVEDVTGITGVQNEVKAQLGTDNLKVKSVKCDDPGIDFGKGEFTLKCTATLDDGTKKVISVAKRSGEKLKITTR